MKYMLIMRASDEANEAFASSGIPFDEVDASGRESAPEQMVEPADARALGGWAWRV